MNAGAAVPRPAEGPPGASALARNMSAPPRMQVVMRPLGVAAPARPRAAAFAPPGFRLHARIDVGRLFAQNFVDTRARSTPRVRLARLVLLARRAVDPGFTPQPGDLRRFARRSEDALADAFIALAARLDPRALGLPNFALLRHCATGVRFELDAARAVAILSRQDGRLFLAARSPSVPRIDDPAQCSFALYVPDGGLADERA